VRAPAARVDHGNVAIAEQTPADDVAPLGLALQRRARPLGGLRALDLGRAGEHGGQHLVDGAVQGQLPAAVFRLVDAHAGLAQLLEDVARFYLLAAQPVGVVDQEHAEGRPRLQGIEQRDEPRPLGELGAADPVVDVDMLVGDGEAVGERVGLRLVELARDALLVGGDVVLVGGLPRVDGSDHGTIGPPSRPYHLVG
jgi:hypothetical protein